MHIQSILRHPKVCIVYAFSSTCTILYICMGVKNIHIDCAILTGDSASEYSVQYNFAQVIKTSLIQNTGIISNE